MTAVLKIENLTHVYSRGTPFEHTAVDSINLEIPRGEFIGLIGHTGSGKSTLIQHLNGLLKPTSGRVLFNGEDIYANKKKTVSVRCRIGLVFQYPEYQLFEETVYKDIAFGPKNMKLGDAEIDERVREAAGFVNIPEDMLEKSPFDLSGGQKRRVAIAGVIAMRPEVLILDEPTAGLDPGGCEEILANIRDYHKKTGATVIMVSHSMEDVAENADRIIVMNEGKVFLNGTPDEVFSHGRELEGIGLDLPGITRIMQKLKAKGVPVNDAVYTFEQAERELMRLRGERDA